MERTGFKCLWVLVSLLVLRVTADCTSYGVDYANGGSYYIDGSSNQYFSFITIFQGCAQESITPVLIGPDNNQYACSVIKTEPAGVQVTSTCGIPFSYMKSGVWKIIVAGNQVSSQRTIGLTVGLPQTTWVTVSPDLYLTEIVANSLVKATPTVVIGYTTTAKAQTAFTTIVQTQTLIIVPRTVTATCSGATRTVTSYPQATTTTVQSTVVRTERDGEVTSRWTTTLATTASCHYPTKKRRNIAPTPQVKASVAAITSTVTQTTYTVTSTSITTVPGRTTTETVLRTTTATVTPPATTVCAGNGPGRTVTITRGTATPVTLTDIVYLTSKIAGTVWEVKTQFSTISNTASATACWRAGGWYGK
ncbi:hypothetical protein QBC43DRAFT_288705 [Cladorrhinum sp. PSN259]|nr:hypothetical protein QBC43DRAFT_288705 [Cladorrhinum sp. PSN259]